MSGVKTQKISRIKSICIWTLRLRTWFLGYVCITLGISSTAISQPFIPPVQVPTQKKDTPNFYLCTDKVGGELTVGSEPALGRFPSACNYQSFGLDQVPQIDFTSHVFIDKDPRTAERTRYVRELHASIKNAAERYYRIREPFASDEEVAQWLRLVLTTGIHESGFSHYRQTTDDKIKLLRGDSGHGHGMMQIDDRWHFPAIEDGVAANFLTNLTYAMDLLYVRWQNAAAASCVKRPDNYQARIRATWSAYNGGDGPCRWTKFHPKYGQYDVDFFTKLQAEQWRPFILDFNAPSSVDISCLSEYRENCPPPPIADNGSELVNNQLYKTIDGNFCVLSAKGLECVKEYRDSICLKKFGDFKRDLIEIADSRQNSTQTLLPSSNVGLMFALYADFRIPSTVTMHDRHQLCAEIDPYLLKVGSRIRTKINLPFRTTPGGGISQDIPAHSEFELVDFELRYPPDMDRYYQVVYKNKYGWIKAGDKNKNYVTSIVKTDSTLNLAKIGDQLRIKAANGINLRTQPNGEFITHIPTHTRAIVQEVVVRGEANEVSYKILFRGVSGYIYSGRLKPTNTLSLWTTKLEP